jgi:PAS domain S-box-containing protein
MDRKPLTILNVDPMSDTLLANSSFLRSRGYLVLEAPSGNEALQEAKRQKPDILLLGSNLSDIDPRDFCRLMKADNSTETTLIIQIVADESTDRAHSFALESGADGYLISPFSNDELHARILAMERIKRTEERIRASEEFFREVTENASDIVLILDRRGVLTYASPSVERFLGYRPDEMVGKSAFRFIHQTDLERAMRDFRKAVRLKELAIPNAFRILHKNGSERILEGLGKNLLDKPVIAGFVMNVHDVTDRRRVEEASRIFAHTLESISEIVTITDFNDRLTFVNQAFLHAYGYQRKEVIGQHVGMLWSPNNPDGLLKEILEQNRVRSWSGELLNLAKDGREFPISLHTSRIKNEQGETVGLVGISEDITERRRAEETLRQSEAKYRDLVEQLDEVIFATDLNGTFTYISPTAEHLSGYKPEEMVGHSIGEFIDPLFLSRVQERYGRATPGNLDPIEFRVKAKSGELLWARSSSRIVLEGGRPIGMRGVLTNITAQKQAQETVNLLSHAIRSISECVSITDDQNNILFVNEAFLRVYGYSEGELIGKHINVVAPDASSVGTVLEGTFRGGWQGELVNRKRDGTKFPIFLSTSVVLDENDNAIALIGIASDITERKKIEEELDLQKKHLVESYEQLRQTEVARDTLLHMIIHDMRSRLTVLMMGLQLLESNALKNTTGENRRVLVRTMTTTMLLSQMINSLLDVNKMESGEMKLKLAKYNITDLVRGLISLYEVQWENRQVIVDTPKESVEVTCDADLISRVVQNLFTNALKHTKSHDTILVRIERIDEGVKTSVQDSGAGIPSQHISRIFEKFYQAESKEVSTGLGLTFCKMAVELHGGRVGVESEEGKGSLFWFMLPSVRQ